MSEPVAEGKIVLFHYTLTNDAGETLDSSAGGPPLGYLHGAGSIVPGLESALTGKVAGDKLDVVVPAGEAYGEYVAGAVHKVPRTQFPPDVNIQVGMQFGAEGPDGQPVAVWVRAVDDNEVSIDFNHPLAGQQLHFAVEILTVREASTEERMHGHPHGAGGHDHGHDHG
jgi:FKBP-type peptidyl-prolyl cis-trans isomerase SlyD